MLSTVALLTQLVPISSDFLARVRRATEAGFGAPARGGARHAGKKIGLGENFFLHWRGVSPISKSTPREKKRDKAATG